ncbi:hypothetical protein [Paenibacillus lutrae]|uniref:Uncharacterized protein n=1 Tax=Paenibacillus lutrae TaxID=2078573 RepID=A0A7X3FI23_9BACL|nr:hypothetical protein [Paenibacillus lutrae]MVO99883.1 hypothetical protein [Paenibacillus lutrae]
MTALWGTITLLVFGFLVVTVFIKSIQGARDQYGSVGFDDDDEDEDLSPQFQSQEWLEEEGAIQEWTEPELGAASPKKESSEAIPIPPDKLSAESQLNVEGSSNPAELHKQQSGPQR